MLNCVEIYWKQFTVLYLSSQLESLLYSHTETFVLEYFVHKSTSLRISWRQVILNKGISIQPFCDFLQFSFPSWISQSLLAFLSLIQIIRSLTNSIQTRLYSFRFNCSIVSFTAANTNRIFSVSVAHVKWEYIILSESGFRSTNILRMNSRAACASHWGPVQNKSYYKD